VLSSARIFSKNPYGISNLPVSLILAEVPPSTLISSEEIRILIRSQDGRHQGDFGLGSDCRSYGEPSQPS
jgi:hypothetical protein